MRYNQVVTLPTHVMQNRSLLNVQCWC